jgi:hypothetical protein
MKGTILAAALALAGCGRETWPDVSTRYAIAGDSVTCDGPVKMGWAPHGGPLTGDEIPGAPNSVGYCAFSRVSVNGENTCLAVVSFERTDALAPWGMTGVSAASNTTACE